MGNYEIFSKRLKELRNDMNLTQKQFSEKIGFTQATLSAYENTPKSPSLDIVIDIAEKCNVSLDWLCGLSDKKNTDDEMTTYADYLKLLIRLSNADIEKLHVYVKTENKKQTDEDFVIIEINDDTVSDFFKKWKKVLELYKNGIIEENLYLLWIDDALKEYEKIELNRRDAR